MWLTHLEFDATNPFMRHWFDVSETLSDMASGQGRQTGLTGG
jgi:hypothetical protein